MRPITLSHVVVATDGSERAALAVGFASNLARCFEASLTLIHVTGGPGPVPGPVAQQAQEAGARIELVVSDRPAEAIVETAKLLEADAIVLGNLGMSDRKEFLLGNVPNRVSHQADCSVFIVDTRDRKAKKKARR